MRDFGWRKCRILAVAGVVAAASGLASAAPALADSASLGVTTTTGQSDPAAGLPRIFTLSGTAGVAEHAYLKVRAPGGAPCAPTAYADSGTRLQSYSDVFYGNSVNGSFNLQDVTTWNTPGTYVFCIWLAASDTSVTMPITQTITFRSPTGTVTGTVSPTTPIVDQEATATVTGASEAPERLYATIKAGAGTSCAPTYDADTGRGVIDGQAVNGSFSIPQTFTESTAGPYVLCLWLANSSTDPAPIAGPQPETFTVTKPAPPPQPCVVPDFGGATTLASVEQSLHAAGCTVGHVGYAANVNVPRGGVVSLSPSPNTQLAPGAAVAVVVSTGQPCVVPSIRRGARLGNVEAVIRAAHCGIGRISRTASRLVPRGTVIGLVYRARTRLPTGASVGLVVSSGPARR